MAICSVCGKVNPAGAHNCDLCGAPVGGAGQGAVSVAQGQEGMNGLSGPICPVCRRANRSISVFCAFCGYKLKDPGGPLPYALPGVETPASNHHAPENPNPNGSQPYAPPNAGGSPQKDAPRPFGASSDEAGNIQSGIILKKRYRILRKIAQGGMGAVYESTDTAAPTGTRWAVKEMSPAALPASDRIQAISDFRREAQMLAALEHHNLPKVVETFEEFNKHFLVMEFVPGRTLQNMIDGTPGFIHEERVRVWARQVLDVLSYLHSQNPPIIYRDLKPANIMLLEGTERIKLIDFGIARFHRAGKARDTEAFGTAGYAPPEQYGKGQTDQRSDIYAMAATLHHLVTKHDPGMNPFNWLPVRHYNPTASAQMEAALQRALSLDPQRRFSTVHEFSEALGLALQVTYQGPVEVNSPAQAAPAPQPTQRGHRRPSSSAKSGVPPAQPKSKAEPQAAPGLPYFGQPPVASVPAAVPVATTQTAVKGQTRQPQPRQQKGPQPQQVVDHGTLRNVQQAPPPPAGNSESAPALVVSDHFVDLGEARWNSRPLRKIDLRNAGGGEMRGTVRANQPWVALNVQSFQGNAQTIEVRVRKRRLALGRVNLQVPNLFAIIWTRTRWALPFVGFWLWVLLLVASSLGQKLLWGLAAVVGALLIAEGIMQWWALHVRLFVPAEKLNTGRLMVKSSGGEQQIEVRVKARPSWAQKAFGWSMAALLVAVELGVAVWIALALSGYNISIPVLTF